MEIVIKSEIFVKEEPPDQMEESDVLLAPEKVSTLEQFMYCYILCTRIICKSKFFNNSGTFQQKVVKFGRFCSNIATCTNLEP